MLFKLTCSVLLKARYITSHVFNFTKSPNFKILNNYIGMIFNICTVIVPHWEKQNTHASHVTSSTPVRTEQRTVHTWHLKCFSSVWVRKLFSMFYLPQSISVTIHIWRVSLQYKCTCAFAKCHFEQSISHAFHMWMVSFQYECANAFSCDYFEQSTMRTSHIWRVPPVRMHIWVFKMKCTAKHNPNISQFNGFSPLCVHVLFQSVTSGKA